MVDQVDSYPKEWDEGNKFHYAMASRWHFENETAHKEEMSADKLAKWLKGCLIYVKEQLLYIEDKKPAAAE
jgi:hypothetical protein